MIIEMLNGEVIDIADYNIKMLSNNIPSPGIQHVTTEVEGRGQIILDTQLVNRTISANFIYDVKDIQDFYRFRNLMNSLFAKTEEFYITFKKNDDRRWRVKLANSFQVDPTILITAFTLEFITTRKFSEKPSLTVQTFNSNEFTLNYLGNAIHDPRENDLEIEIVCTASSQLRVVNNNNGDVYTINGPLTVDNLIRIVNIRTLINNVSNYGRTNGGLINLQPGENYFNITGGTIDRITFKYRELYQ